MGKSDALLVLHNQLVKGGRQDYAQVIPAKYAKLSAVDVYDRFLGVRMETKGMLASGYGASGYELEFSAGMDFGDLVLPGLLSLTFSLGTAVQGKSFALLLIHRSVPVSLPSPAASRAGALWKSRKPTCFMTLFGRSFQIKLAAGSSVYVYHEIVELPKKGTAGALLSLTELPLTLSAGAAVEGSYTYQAMKVYDGAPGWYTSEQEPTLKTDFHTVIQTIAKADLKIAIKTWLSNFDDIYDWSTAKKRIVERTGTPSFTAKDVWDDYLSYQVSHHNRVRSLQRVKDRVTRIYKAAAAGSPVDPTLIGKKFGSYWDLAMSHSLASADLQAQLLNIISLIPQDDYVDSFTPRLRAPADKRMMPKIKQETGLIRNQAIEFYYRLADAIDQQTSGLPPSVVPEKKGALAATSNTPWWYLTFLKISSHAVEGTASANATPLIATLQGKVTGQIKRTVYRYQTYAMNESADSTLVFTQDTAIVYRQAAMEASAQANLVFYKPKKAFAKEINSTKFVVNGLTYRSIGVYWLYPPAAQAAGQPDTVPTQVGSGLTFGVSVNSDDLLTMLSGIEQIQAKAQQGAELKLSPEYTRLLETLAGYLRISRKTLGEFLAAIPKAKQAEWGTMESLLIEASYSFKPLYWPVTWKIKDDLPVCELRGLWEHDPYSSVDSFDALRIRCRMADHRESTHSFRLEGKYVAKIGITLSEVKEAGTLSVLDLHTQLYNGKDHETAVPPVALFHQ